jgi:hypothetical protein
MSVGFVASASVYPRSNFIAFPKKIETYKLRSKCFFKGFIYTYHFWLLILCCCLKWSDSNVTYVGMYLDEFRSDLGIRTNHCGTYIGTNQWA